MVGVLVAGCWWWVADGWVAGERGGLLPRGGQGEGFSGGRLLMVGCWWGVCWRGDVGHGLMLARGAGEKSLMGRWYSTRENVLFYAFC